MKTLLIALITIITVSLQAQDNNTNPTPQKAKQETAMISVSIPMMGDIQISDKSGELKEELKPFLKVSKQVENRMDSSQYAVVEVETKSAVLDQK